MTVISLKILPVYFPEVCAGRKRAELRKDDRGFRVADADALVDAVMKGGNYLDAYFN